MNNCSLGRTSIVAVIVLSAVVMYGCRHPEIDKEAVVGGAPWSTSFVVASPLEPTRAGAVSFGIAPGATDRRTGVLSLSPDGSSSFVRLPENINPLNPIPAGDKFVVRAYICSPPEPDPNTEDPQDCAEDVRPVKGAYIIEGGTSRFLSEPPPWVTGVLYVSEDITIVDSDTGLLSFDVTKERWSALAGGEQMSRPYAQVQCPWIGLSVSRDVSSEGPVVIAEGSAFTIRRYSASGLESESKIAFGQDVEDPQPVGCATNGVVFDSERRFVTVGADGSPVNTTAHPPSGLRCHGVISTFAIAECPIPAAHTTSLWSFAGREPRKLVSDTNGVDVRAVLDMSETHVTVVIGNGTEQVLAIDG